MNCKKAVCYVGGCNLTNLPVSHTGKIPTIRIQDDTARKFAETIGIQVEEYFCDLGENLNRLSAPNFMKMVAYLKSYRERHNESCLVIIYSESCVAHTNEEFVAISKMISDAGGIMAISSLVDETVQ